MFLFIKSQTSILIFSIDNYYLNIKILAKKLFLTLEEWQKNIVLSDTVWLDETYYSVIMSDREHKEDGTLPRGLSRNQICIGVATDKKHTVCIMEGYGMLSLGIRKHFELQKLLDKRQQYNDSLKE